MVESSGQLTDMDVLIAAGAGFDWGVVAIPHTTATPSQNAFGASINILKSTPEKELASWLFIQYLTSPENQAKWSSVSRFLPVRASPADFFDDEFENTPEYQTALT